MVAGLEKTLLTLSKTHDMALAEGGRYPGLYLLSGHPNPAVRLLVCGFWNWCSCVWVPIKTTTCRWCGISNIYRLLRQADFPSGMHTTLSQLPSCLASSCRPVLVAECCFVLVSA